MVLENYYKQIIKRDLVNKFNYKSTKQVPKFRKIILNFSCKTGALKDLSTIALAIELLVSERKTLVKTNKASVNLKIRKGQPVGFVVSILNSKMYAFLSKLNLEAFPNAKNFKGVLFKKNNNESTFSFTLEQLTAFQTLEEHFYLFNNLPNLNINLVTNKISFQELRYLSQSIKIPFARKKSFLKRPD